MRHHLIQNPYHIKGGAIKLGNILHPIKNSFKTVGNHIKHSFNKVSNDFNKLKLGGTAQIKLIKGINESFGVPDNLGSGVRRKKIKPLKFNL